MDKQKADGRSAFIFLSEGFQAYYKLLPVLMLPTTTPVPPFEGGGGGGVGVPDPVPVAPLLPPLPPLIPGLFETSVPPLRCDKWLVGI